MKHPIARRSFNDRSTIRALHSHDSRTNVLVAQAVEPSRSQVYSILEKIGDALERGTKVVDGGTKAVGKVFSFLPPLSIGIGFGTGCGVGIGWSFQQVRREGLISPPRMVDGAAGKNEGTSKSHVLRGGSDGSFNVGDAIDSFPCRDAYLALEECLGENDRDWTKCQVQVRDLRACHEKKTHENDSKSKA
ncbi:hypothetical protein NDN08_006719 [Rhodosorus marinus]|uniref:CHCH domain-containing protein n=1 Tax=Rhodosorus marinus TaxID=101924 RepID=A0AAV8UM08_9RHOD|nr:hypothetical protein NDN08_006719 [Rhodosorus marinus]